MQPGELLSNGKSEAPEGKLFAYPTVVLFARNIKVTKSTYDKISTEASKKTGGRAAFNLGPFSLGSKADYNTTSKNVDVTQEDDKIVVPGMQVIGFRNHILPLCPDPDPAITNWI